MGYAKASAATIKRFTDYSGFALMILLALGIIKVNFASALAYSQNSPTHQITDSPNHQQFDSTNVRIISVCANIFVYLRFVKNTDKKHGKNPKRYGCITITLP